MSGPDYSGGAAGLSLLRAGAATSLAGRALLEPAHGFGRLIVARMLGIAGDLLVTAHRPRNVAQRLVGLAELEQRVGPALGTVAEFCVTWHGQVRPGKVVEVHVAQHLMGAVPGVLIGVADELRRLRFAKIFQHLQRPLLLALP